MAKSLYTIQMDFKNANDCAAKLEEAARELTKLANNKFQNEIRKVEACWSGDNSQIYVSKCNSLRQQMEKTANQLLDTAKTIRVIAKNTYNADIKARQIALTKSTGGK